jgi:hypothetical protein
VATSSCVKGLVLQIVGPEGGASCDLLPPQTPVSQSNVIKRRFQRGSVDEISFVGPNLGSLDALVIGPEMGKWQLDEVIVSNSREALTQRFVWRDGLSEEGAMFLTPLPKDSIIYGSGDQAIIMSPVRSSLFWDSQPRTGRHGIEH